jgi:CheY-like chemotaxis protein
MMAESILNGKRILAVDDEPDVLAVLEEEILDAAPKCKLEKVTTYHEATLRLASRTYDIVILDIMGIRGFELLNLSTKRNLTVTMLTAHALYPQSLKRSIEMKARAYLPKEKIGEIVPFLEDVLRYENLPGWARLLQNLGGFFDSRWGENWKRTDEKFWKEFDEKIAFIKK